MKNDEEEILGCMKAIARGSNPILLLSAQSHIERKEDATLRSLTQSFIILALEEESRWEAVKERTSALPRLGNPALDYLRLYYKTPDKFLSSELSDEILRFDTQPPWLSST